MRPIADVIAMAFEHERLAADEKERRRKYEGLQALAPGAREGPRRARRLRPVSEIVRPVVPHDRMALGLLTEDRAADTRLRGLGHRLPGDQGADPADARRPGARGLVDRDRPRRPRRPGPRVRQVPASFRGRGSARILRVPDLLRGPLAVRGRPALPSRARRTRTARTTSRSPGSVADQVALALSHQRLAEEARRAAEARAEAETLEKRVAALSEELASRGGLRPHRGRRRRAGATSSSRPRRSRPPRRPSS